MGMVGRGPRLLCGQADGADGAGGGGGADSWGGPGTQPRVQVGLMGVVGDVASCEGRADGGCGDPASCACWADSWGGQGRSLVCGGADGLVGLTNGLIDGGGRADWRRCRGRSLACGRAPCSLALSLRHLLVHLFILLVQETAAAGKPCSNILGARSVPCGPPGAGPGPPGKPVPSSPQALALRPAGSTRGQAPSRHLQGWRLLLGAVTSGRGLGSPMCPPPPEGMRSVSEPRTGLQWPSPPGPG